MAGVKVTLLRTSVNIPGSGQPVERIFEQADTWKFISGDGIENLFVMVNDKPANDGSFSRTVIAEFPTSNIESVELYSKETA